MPATAEPAASRRGAIVGAVLALLTAAVRLAPAWLLATETSDVATYRAMAETVLRGDNVYARALFFPYTPYSELLPAAMLRLAHAAGWRFDVTMKLPPIASDVLVTLLLWTALNARGASPRAAVGWCLAWALNPVSILISAFHGNLMPVVALLVLASLREAELAEADDGRAVHLASSALLLGIAIAMRSFPVLLLPVPLLLHTRSFKERWRYAALAALPAAVATLPYLLEARHTLLREVLSYSGFVDLGWMAVVRALRAARLGIDDLYRYDLVWDLMQRTKGLFLTAYAAAVLSLPRRRDGAGGRALLLAPLLFYGVYGGVSAQYLIWVLPVALLLRERMALAFTAVATVALVSFYWVYHPGILAGPYAEMLRASATARRWMAAGNAALVVVCLVWLAAVVTGLRRGRAAPLSSWGGWFEDPVLERVRGALLLAALLGTAYEGVTLVPRAWEYGRAYLSS